MSDLPKKLNSKCNAAAWKKAGKPDVQPAINKQIAAAIEALEQTLATLNKATTQANATAMMGASVEVRDLVNKYRRIFENHKEAANLLTLLHKEAAELHASGIQIMNKFGPLEEFRKMRVDFIKEITPALKRLEDYSDATKRKLAETDTNLKATINALKKTPGSATMFAGLAAESAKEASTIAKEAETYAEGLQSRLATQRNSKPGDFGLTTEDVQVHAQLTAMTYRIFEHYDKLRHEVSRHTALAQKAAKDAALHTTQSQSSQAFWENKLQSDGEELAGILDKLKTTVSSGWGSQISKKGKEFADRKKQLAQDPKLKGGMIKTCEQAEPLMAKALNIARTLVAEITEDCAGYINALPPGYAKTHAKLVAPLLATTEQAKKILKQFEKDYALSVEELKKLKKATES